MTGPDDAFLAPEDALHDLPGEAGAGTTDVDLPEEPVPPREEAPEDRAGGSGANPVGGAGPSS
ncbi:hypothetical protein [Geodermatophilus sp. CPCC 206100]|uniref:hypothetical protein n=1 Tax=Geodermatophilus sp. CPCC 206100 TaxID=3020054 RepID=UPI003B00F76A